MAQLHWYLIIMDSCLVGFKITLSNLIGWIKKRRYNDWIETFIKFRADRFSLFFF